MHTRAGDEEPGQTGGENGEKLSGRCAEAEGRGRVERIRTATTMKSHCVSYGGERAKWVESVQNVTGGPQTTSRVSGADTEAGGFQAKLL